MYTESAAKGQSGSLQPQPVKGSTKPMVTNAWSKKYPEPNAADPLSESTYNRRLWAAYLAAGYDRASFSRAMDSSYVQVTAWDHGKSAMSFAAAVRASELVDYTLDQLVYGKAGRPRLMTEASLGEPALRELFDELRVDDDATAAWVAFRETSVGAMQRATRTYVVTWIMTYVAARSGKARPDVKAIGEARRAADNARAARDRQDAGRVRVDTAKRERKTKRMPRPRPRLPAAPPSEASS